MSTGNPKFGSTILVSLDGTLSVGGTNMPPSCFAIGSRSVPQSVQDSSPSLHKDTLPCLLAPEALGRNRWIWREDRVVSIVSRFPVLIRSAIRKGSERASPSDATYSVESQPSVRTFRIQRGRRARRPRSNTTSVSTAEVLLGDRLRNLFLVGVDQFLGFVGSDVLRLGNCACRPGTVGLIQLVSVLR